MRVMKVFLLFALAVSIIGCANEQVSGEGFILETREDSILVVQNITAERFNEIKDISSDALIDQGGLDLIWLEYEEANEFDKGDHVTFSTDGGVRESYPAQADAKKIERK